MGKYNCIFEVIIYSLEVDGIVPKNNPDKTLILCVIVYQ